MGVMRSVDGSSVPKRATSSSVSGVGSPEDTGPSCSYAAVEVQPLVAALLHEQLVGVVDALHAVAVALLRVRVVDAREFAVLGLHLPLCGAALEAQHLKWVAHRRAENAAP